MAGLAKQKQRAKVAEDNTKLSAFASWFEDVDPVPATKKKEPSPSKSQLESGNTKAATKNGDKEAPQRETASKTEEREEVIVDVIASPASQQKANGEIQQRLWEKEQLQEINLRIGNILNVFSSKADKAEKSGLDTDALSKLQEQHIQALKNLSDNFLQKEQQKANELVDLTNDLKDLKDKYSQLEQELQDTNSKLQNLKKDKTNLKNQKDQAIREKERLAQEIQDLQFAMDARLKALEGENKALVVENARLKAGFGDSEEELQKKYAAQLAEALQEQEENHNLLKAKMEDMYQNKLNNLENAFNKQMDDLVNINEDQSKKIGDLEKDWLKAAQERDQALKDLEKEKQHRDTLKNDLEKQKNDAKNWKNKADELEKEKQKILDEKTTVEKGNIDLRNEIEKLKEKLDMFEEKHHIRSPIPPKKRRRTDSTLMEAKVLKAVKGPIIDGHLIFPLECITRQYEGDWVGFELQNQWNKPILLKGWALTDTDRTSRLPLPERQLNPKDVIRVCLTDNTKEETDLIWKGLNLKKGDKHELWVEDELNSRHKLAVIPIPANTPGFAPESCFVM